jgi:hypothetical protein
MFQGVKRASLNTQRNETTNSLDTVRLEYNELGYNELDYNELGYYEQILKTNWII